MELFNTINNLFSGRPSTVPRASSNTGKRKHEHGNSSSSSGGLTTTSSGSGAGASSARRAGKRDDGVHGIMTSALWAVARTPALVEAIQRVEATYHGEASTPLSRILAQLSRGAKNLGDAPEAADAFLRASRLTVYDHMDPMDAIRAIVGLCADSEQVLEDAVSTTYRTTMKCNMEGCKFTKDGGREKEEYLQCKSPRVQLSIEIRAASLKKDLLCALCNKKGVGKRYIMEKPAPCLVATWPALAQVESNQEMLFLTDRSSKDFDQFRFKLGVMIVNRASKFVCVFREGPNCYRVEGKSVKKINAQDWHGLQPCLAIFNYQGVLGDTSPRSRGPRGTGLPSFAANGGGQAGRKRQRQHVGYGQLSGGSGSSSSSSSRARGGAVAAAEVIEVDDDDDSDRGGEDTSPPADGGGGGGDAGGRPDGDSSGGDAGASGENGAAVANGSEGKGKRRSRVGEGEAEAKPTPRQALDSACEEALLADKPAESAATDGGGRSGSGGTAAAGPEPPAAVPAAAAIPTRPKRTARDGREGAGSSPGAAVTSFRREDQEAPRDCDRKENPVGGLPRIPSCSDGSPGDSGMEQGESPSGVGASSGAGSACNGSNRPVPSLASGTASSSGQRPRYLDDSGGAARAGRAESAAEVRVGSPMDVESEDDDNDDDVQLVASKRQNLRRGEEGEKRSSAVSSPSSSAARAGAGAGSSSRTVSGGLPATRTSDSPRQRDSEKGARGTASGGSLGSLGCSPSTRLAEREIHDVDDDTSPAAPPAAAANAKKHPSGVPMPFIGPRVPPRPNGAAPFIGPARPPPSKPEALPPRPRPPAQQQTPAGAPWIKRNTQEEARRKAAAAARANRGARKAGGGSNGGAAKGGAGGQATILSSWKKTGASSNNASAHGRGGGGGGGGGGSSSGTSARRKPPGSGAAFMGAGGGGGSGSRLGGGSGSGGGGSGGGGSGGGSSSRPRRPRSGGEKVMEDLTGADDSWHDLEDVNGAGIGGGWPPGFVGGAGGDETLTTIRGINLQRDHFDRILDEDGWLTSQIIDIRVKQLQELYPQHLYFDTSFFGFLCPSTERGGAFVVDYARVKGWTKSSRLPGGKSSLFDMQKLFIPINQGNVHWVLVVVDMDGGGRSSSSSSSSAKSVSFFDSFGRDGTTYVEAVQQYLVSELSNRDKTRQERFSPRSRPPSNAPRQHNSSDCGVLMLHVMEELSTRRASELTQLTQEEIMSLRLQLVAKIRE